MILSYNPKLIFIHLPKTGGTSFTHGLRPYLKGKVVYGSQQNPDWKHHVRAKDFKSRLPDYDDFFTFTIVRNPYDRIYSWCSMMNAKQMVGKPVDKDTFKKWLFFGSKNMKTIPQKNNQYDWLVDKDDNIIVDYIGRFESLQSHFDEIVTKIGGVKTDLPKRRVSNRIRDYREVYDQESIEFIKEYHGKDLEYFNYSF